MKRISTLFLCLIMVASTLIMPFGINGSAAAENEYLDSYSFSFKKESTYNYTAAVKSSNTQGYLTFTPDGRSESVTIAPLHAPSQYENNWTVPTAEYKEVTAYGKNVGSLEVFANNETYLVPIKEDGKPFELAPGTEYVIEMSYLHTSNLQNDTAKVRVFCAASGLQAPFNTMANAKNNVPLTMFGENSYLSRPFASSNFSDPASLPADTSTVINSTVTLSTPAENGEGYIYDADNNTYKVSVGGTEYTLHNYLYLYFGTTAKPTVNIISLSISKKAEVNEYTFSFAEDKVYNYTPTSKNDAAKGILSYTPEGSSNGVNIAPIHAPTQYENNWNPATAQYEKITADGKETDSLKVYANNETYLVPIKEDGEPFEMKPGKTYEVSISYTHSANTQSDDSKVRGFYAASGYLAPFNSSANKRDKVPLTMFGENSYLSRPFASESIDDLSSLPTDTSAVIKRTVTVTTPAAEGEGYTYDEEKNAYIVKVEDTEYALYNIFFLYFETYAKPTLNITALSIKEFDPDADISVTFVNTLTGEENVVTGKRGEPITYPEEPYDEERKFAGWYLTQEYTEPFIVTVFPDASMTVYSRFIDPPPSAVEDFDSYKSHEYEVVENSNGSKNKSNRPYFGDMLSLDNNTVYSGGYSLKYNWDSTMVRDEQDANSYDAAGRYSSPDAKALLEDVKIADKTLYLVSFKYFVEKADGEIHVSAASGQSVNLWGDINIYKTSQPGSHFVVPAFNADGEWHEGEFVVTTSFVGKGTSMFIILNLPQNADATVYIDDVRFTPIKDNESYIKYDSIVTSKIFVGKIGENIPEYTPVNGKYTFLGWYADKECTEEFTKTVFEEMPITAYASWNKLPITFDNDFNGRLSTDSLTVENKDGIGEDDDYALKFSYNGDKVYDIKDDGTKTYYKERYYAPDNNILIKEGLLNDTVYVITYDVKVNSANLNVNVLFANASPDSIWSGLTQHQTTAVTLGSKNVGKGWVRKTVALKTGTLSFANCLYLYFTLENNLDGRKAEILVDNVLVEELYDTSVVFNPSNGSGSIVIKGNAGDKITAPASPEKFAYEFNGWYLDKETTLKFEKQALEENQVFFLYPLYTDAKSITFDYENYYVPYTDKTKGLFQRHDCEVVKKSFAYSGEYVMKADRSYVNNPEFNLGGAGHLVANGTMYKRFDNTKNYIVTFKYYIEKHGQSPLMISARAAAQNNFWAQYLVSNYYYVNLDEQTGKWHTGTLVVNGSLIEKTSMNYLFLAWVKGNEGMYYVDDVTVTEMPEGNMAYFIDNGGCTNIPEYVMGKPGQSFKSQLPQNPKYDNHNFIGYFVMGDDGKYKELDTFTFAKGKEIEIVARFIRIKTTQDFETPYLAAVDSMPGYNIKDYDYEVYDSEAEGNSKDNVISATHSLHRKGKTQFFENALLLTQSQQLISGEKYTMTMRVKMTSYLQTDGAIKIVSNNSPYFAWATYGDYFPVVAISDLTDGTWHEVSYTFTAIEPYVSLQTPGYVELFIDDVTFVHVDKNTPVSTPVTFTEYVPARRDLATGEIIETNYGELTVDVDSIIDPDMGSGKVNITLIAIIAGGVAIIAAAVIILLLLKRKKKS